MPNKLTVVIIGCGNVAWHLAEKLSSLKKYNIYVVNHKENLILEKFSSKLKCVTLVDPNFELLPTGADFYFFCVKDEFIKSTSSKLGISNPRAVFLHTSGSVDIKGLEGNVKHKAVFYPLQSFSINTKVDWKKIPILIEANSKPLEKLVTELGIQFSNDVTPVNSKQRLLYHLAAVFVNNFSNYLYSAADDLLKTEKLQFKLLLPLIENTYNKLQVLTPLEAQTGPAKRKDNVTINKHLNLLEKNKELTELYKLITKQIEKQ